MTKKRQQELTRVQKLAVEVYKLSNEFLNSKYAVKVKKRKVKK